MTHHLTSNKQKEAESKRKPPSEPICCTTTGRSAANSLAQTIGAASLSTREAQVKSTASPPHLRERRSQPRSAAGEPTPPSAPQAGIFRSGPRATRFGAAALLSSLGSCSCCSQQRSSSSACRSRACERASLLFTTSCLLQIFCFYFGSPTAYPCLRPMARYLCAGVGVVVRILINILAGRECACVCV